MNLLKRTTSLQRTKQLNLLLSPTCPLLGGSTVSRRNLHLYTGINNYEHFLEKKGVFYEGITNVKYYTVLHTVNLNLWTIWDSDRIRNCLQKKQLLVLYS